MKDFTYLWQREDAGDRVDRVLSRAMGISRAQVQRFLDAQAVLWNDRVAGARDKVREGDTLTVRIPELKASTIQSEELPLSVVYEDRELIAINKQPGMVVHPGAGHWEGTLVSALLHHCRGELSGIGGVERPGIVHRLDKDTSGLILAAKNDRAHESLAAQFKNRSIRKWYQAMVLGVPGRKFGTWDGPIGRHRIHRQKMAVLKSGGRETRTDFKVLKSWPGRASNLELELHTGRTHQIRVHCAHAGHPVVGDAVYGRRMDWLKAAGVERQMLHAWKLSLEHPVNGKRIELVADLPDDFRHLEEHLEKAT